MSDISRIIISLYSKNRYGDIMQSCQTPLLISVHSLFTLSILITGLLLPVQVQVQVPYRTQILPINVLIYRP